MRLGFFNSRIALNTLYPCRESSNNLITMATKRSGEPQLLGGLVHCREGNLMHCRDSGLVHRRHSCFAGLIIDANRLRLDSLAFLLAPFVADLTALLFKNLDEFCHWLNT